MVATNGAVPSTYSWTPHSWLGVMELPILSTTLARGRGHHGNREDLQEGNDKCLKVPETHFCKVCVLLNG